MKTGLRSYLVAGAALYLIASLQGCRVKDLQESSPLVLVSVAIQSSSQSLAPGTTLQLRAIGTYSDRRPRDVTHQVVWESANHEVATVNGAGLATASTSGSTTISATMGSISGTTVLTVSPLVSIAVTPAGPSIAPGTTLRFFATGTLLNGATQDFTGFVTWDSTDKTVATISGTGVATANPEMTGTTTITAMFGGVTGQTQLTTASVTSIAVTPAASVVALGATQQFTATGTLSNTVTQDLTGFAVWSSQPAGIATINSTGLATPLKEGFATITATFGGVSGSTTLMVNAPSLVSIAVTPASQSVALGQEQQFTATGTLSDGTTEDFTASATWTSSNTHVATIAGTAGLASTLARGTTTITATLAGVTSNAATLTVVSAKLASITVTPSNPSIVIGLTRQFTATGTFTDGTSQVMTTAVTWSSSSTAVAFISNAFGTQGLATSTGTGSTTITATSGSISGSTVLTVSAL